MKTIGLIGGLSWESTKEYYRLINEQTRGRLGGLHSAEILMSSVDFAPLAAAMAEGRWADVQAVLTDRARRLREGGADVLLICTNTMHKLAAEVAQAATPVPLIHIGACTAAEAVKRGFSTVALMGTRFTMEEDFYRSELEGAGLNVVLPGAREREWLNSLIFDELCAGIFREESRETALEIAVTLKNQGAQALVLGCTELPLIMNDSPLPILDTMLLHAEAAVNAALE